MKKSIVSLALWSCGLLLMIGAVVSCTTKRNPNIKVQFVNSRVGWIVGARLLSTTDGGRTWNVIRSEGFGTFEAEYIGYGHRAIQFIDSATGVQLGGNVLTKTTDGGRTWTERFLVPKPVGQDIPPQSLFFISPEIGWVIGEYVYQTTDGGRSWISLSKTPVGDHQRQRAMHVAPSFADYMPAIWFSDPRNGLMARLDGEVYSTNDGGKTWEMTWKVDKRITDLFFNNQEGWIVGDDGLIARTNDGGRTWSSASTQTKTDLTSIFFLDKQLGWAAGSEGTILYTRDSGVTWQRSSIVGLLGSPPLASVSFTDALHGWAVGGNSDPMHPSLFAPSNVVLSTDDGGQTWRAIHP
jgi:photosystem II stability/assembly factor-like uncharacterized protein